MTIKSDFTEQNTVPNKQLDLKYYSVYQFLFQTYKGKSDTIKYLLQYIIAVLKGLEDQLETSTSNFIDLVQTNTNASNTQEMLESFIKNLRDEKQDNYRKKNYGIRINLNKKEPQNSKYILNDILNQITILVDETVNFSQLVLELEGSNINRNENQVFLSYAHMDKLYTLGLYFLFQTQGVYLFIDWMHNGLIDNVADLKNLLDIEMKRSRQFLFLRTSNSELGILGAGQIRQWCAWEIGNYYCKDLTNKFYTVIYYEDKITTENKLLQTFRPLIGIQKGLMI